MTPARRDDRSLFHFTPWRDVTLDVRWYSFQTRLHLVPEGGHGKEKARRNFDSPARLQWRSAADWRLTVSYKPPLSISVECFVFFCLRLLCMGHGVLQEI
jgi:hypothetical protein